jgi:SPP1 family predicted phage head-tail adaptor
MLKTKEEIGKLDRRILIQSPVIEINTVSDQAEITSWEDVSEVWAKVEDHTGSEVFEGEQVQAVRGTLFTIRHRTIEMTWRIFFEGEFYDIESVQRPDRKGYLKILGFIGKDHPVSNT